MQILYIVFTAFALTYNTYVHYVADIALSSGFQDKIALQSILDMPLCDYNPVCSIDIAELRILQEIEVRA